MRRRELFAFVVLTLILVLGWAGYRELFGSDPSARFTVTQVRGDVHRVDAIGTDASAAVGDTLRSSDRLVTKEGGGAVLSFGGDSRLTLDSGASLKVLAVDEGGVRVELEGGRVQATVHPGAGTLGVVADGREFSSQDADFTAVRGADGTVGVEATRGDVGVTGVPGTVKVHSGERLTAPAGGGSALVAPASQDLLLYVHPPGAERTREATIEVAGKTAPGAKVRVGRGESWTEVRADATGAFTARVPLVEGENDLAVEASDVFGQTKVSDLHLVRDTRPPSVGGEIRF